jgi:hypothetical protein
VNAPARGKPGQPFAVQVFQYSDKGFTKPAAGANVTGASAPSDAAGTAIVTLAASGTVQATRAGAIPSRALPICVKSNLGHCPKKAGRPIFGSALADDITGTPGPDSVKSADGNDVISVRGGGKDQVQCGSGSDKVKADRSDKVDRVSCERVIRRGGGKAPKK